MFARKHMLRWFTALIGNRIPFRIPPKEMRNGPKKLDSFSSVFKCTVASGYAALNSGFRW